MHDPERVAVMMWEQQEPVIVSISINAYLVVIKGDVTWSIRGLAALADPGSAS